MVLSCLQTAARSVGDRRWGIVGTASSSREDQHVDTAELKWIRRSGLPSKYHSLITSHQKCQSTLAPSVLCYLFNFRLQALLKFGEVKNRPLKRSSFTQQWILHMHQWFSRRLFLLQLGKKTNTTVGGKWKSAKGTAVCREEGE